MRYDKQFSKFNQSKATETETVEKKEQSVEQKPVGEFDITLKGTFRALTKVNFRSEPNVEADILMVLDSRDKVHCDGYYKTVGEVKWLAVSRNNQNGWVMADFLSR